MRWGKLLARGLKPRTTTYGEQRLRVYDNHGERIFEGTAIELAEQVRDGLRYKRALMDIGCALLGGRVCDDTAWFDSYETLFDFIQRALEPVGTEPVDMFGKFPISPDERRIIEWLRGEKLEPRSVIDQDIMDLCAEAIERGDHRKGPGNE